MSRGRQRERERENEKGKNALKHVGAHKNITINNIKFVFEDTNTHTNIQTYKHTMNDFRPSKHLETKLNYSKPTTTTTPTRNKSNQTFNK